MTHAPENETLGTLIPVGGGDPIPLLKPEIVVGRRGSCDIQLDFENVSGKHCTFRLINGVWHVRDMGSTNGTTVNGSRLSSQHVIMPEDEVGIADHLYTIDYIPSARMPCSRPTRCSITRSRKSGSGTR